MPPINEDAIWSALSKVRVPDLQRDVVSLNMVRDLKTADTGEVMLTLVLPPGGQVDAATVEREVKGAIIMLAGVKKVTVTTPGKGAATGGGPAGGPQAMAQGVRHIIGVASGKGGVGKSTVSVNLAAALAKQGAKVGLLDADIYGPNVPLMAGLQGAEPMVSSEKQADGTEVQMIVPVQKHGLKVMSMGFLLQDDQPVVWRGPMLNSALRQFFGQVDWGELDYLIVDLPPGTGDVQISLMQLVKVTGIVHVTTPQEVALADVRRGIAMFQAQNVPLLGIIENMSFFECPHCHERTDIFSHGGGHRIAEAMGIPFLGEIPLDIKVREAGDSGTPLVLSDPEAVQSKSFMRAAEMLAKEVIDMNEHGSGILPLNPERERGSGILPLKGRGFTPARGLIYQKHGGYLPHWRQENGTYAVTFRLDDSLPRETVKRYKEELETLLFAASNGGNTISREDVRRLHKLFSERVDQFLDAGSGDCWLKRDDVAVIVAQALAYFDEQRYLLHAWAIMPNHVHVVVQPTNGHELDAILHSWKSFTANEANKALGRTGPLWQKESYDHLVRDEQDYFHAIEYTLTNPFRAGLADWLWVSNRYQAPYNQRLEAAATMALSYS